MAVLRCKEPFAADVKGVPRVIAAGQLLDSSDPIVRGRERFFEPVDTHMQRLATAVEQATAGPGEKRSVSMPRLAAKRQPKKAAASGVTDG